MSTEYNIDEKLPERAEYLQSIEEFLSAEYEKSAKIRKERYATLDKEILRKEYISMLGYPLTKYDELCCEEILCERKVVSQTDELTIYRLQFRLFSGLRFSGLWFVPTEVEEKNALLIALHGAQGAPEVIGAKGIRSDNYKAFVRRALKKGLTVFAPQLLIWSQERFGEPYDRAAIDKKLRQIGGSIVALEVFCLRRVIDYFSSLPEIDRERIACAGLSYGGMYALALGAADTRIKATLSSCYFNDRTKYLYDWTYFNQAKIGLDAEQALLIADRKLYIELGEADLTFAIDSAKEELHRLERYAKEKTLDFLQVKIHEKGHEFDLSDDGIQFLWNELGV